jgi:DNA-binding MarR family transcriptional regulator
MNFPISFSFLSSACDLRILSALRQIIRSFELHSRGLYQRFQITVPQMVCLLAVSASGGINLSQLAKSVSLSDSTVSGIVNRLEQRGFIQRRRD